MKRAIAVETELDMAARRTIVSIVGSDLKERRERPIDLGFQ